MSCGLHNPLKPLLQSTVTECPTKVSQERIKGGVDLACSEVTQGRITDRGLPKNRYLKIMIT